MNTPQDSDATRQVLQHGPWVQAVAFAVVRDHQLAEDIRQDVLLDALEGGWKGVGLRRAWLAGMSKNRAKCTADSTKSAEGRRRYR